MDNTKLLFPSTKVLLMDGTAKMASELVVGDVLLAPNRDGRTILEISQQKANNYMIIPRYCNSSFVISDSHLFPIIHDTKTFLINIKTIKLQESQHLFSLVHEGVEFPSSFVTLEPYFLGLWLSNNNLLRFNKNNEKVYSFLFNFIDKFSLQHEYDDESITIVDSRLLTQFEKYDLFHNPRIPD